MNLQESKGDSKQIGQYRSKLKALEAKLSALQKKVAANARLERLKTQSEEAVKRLTVDIQGMKRARVEMLKKMERLSKEAAEHRRAQEKALLQVHRTTIPLVSCQSLATDCHHTSRTNLR
jgi:predicted RNase H-like nuclease (RuvC/YqgF family)